MKKAPYSIVYEDENILVVYKERNLFSVMTDDVKTRHHNLYFYLQCYTRQKQEKVFVCHRLDFETSGLMVFAKQESLAHLIRLSFEERTVERRYEAVVREKLSPDFHETVRQFLSENQSYLVYSDEEKGKEAVTIISYANPIQIGTALDIRIETGRKNQIRMALSTLGLTLIGDTRYAKDDAKRMYLNAYSLSFPLTLGLKQNTFSTTPLWIIPSPSCKDIRKPIE